MRPSAPFLIVLTSFVPVLLAVPANAPLAAPDHAVLVSFGPTTFLDTELREAMGTGVAAELGYAGRLRAGRDLWLDVTIAYQRAAGPTFREDPTFELDDSELQVIPVGLGIRELTGVDREAPLRLYLGVGALWAWARWDPPLSPAASASTFGGYVEIRPELCVGSRTDLWLRQRIHIMADTGLDGWTEVNPSALAFTGGVRVAFGRSESGEEEER